MKKGFTSMLALLMCLNLVSCGDKNEIETSQSTETENTESKSTEKIENNVGIEKTLFDVTFQVTSEQKEFFVNIAKRVFDDNNEVNNVFPNYFDEEIVLTQEEYNMIAENCGFKSIILNDDLKLIRI